MLTDQHVVITGGTGSLGKVLLRRLLSNELGRPRKITVFSRDEAKQHALRLEYQRKPAATDEVIYNNFHQLLNFHIGDVRNYASLSSAIQDADVVFNTAALKQVPTCEYFPAEAVATNIQGPVNLIRAIREQRLKIHTVVGISTDKACKPVNVMGMTKAIQERVFLQANLSAPDTRFICVRYGNVLASRGSVVPLFHEQIRNGGPVTITTEDMTRFLLSLEDAVDTIFAAVRHGHRGELYIPRVPSAKVVDIAAVLIGKRPIETKVIGIRPGEKIHEILVSEEEAHRTIARGNYYVIQSILPELSAADAGQPVLNGEYSSGNDVMARADLHRLLSRNGLLDANYEFESKLAA